jgi:hypothetical protein
MLEKIMRSEEGKRRYPAKICHICATHKKTGGTLNTFVISA